MKTVKHEWCAHFTQRRFSRLLYVMWFWRHRGKCAAYSSAVRAVSSLWEKRSKQSWCKHNPFLVCISKTTTRWCYKAECEHNISPLTIKTPKQISEFEFSNFNLHYCHLMDVTEWNSLYCFLGTGLFTTFRIHKVVVVTFLLLLFLILC